MVKAFRLENLAYMAIYFFAGGFNGQAMESAIELESISTPFSSTMSEFHQEDYSTVIDSNNEADFAHLASQSASQNHGPEINPPLGEEDLPELKFDVTLSFDGKLFHKSNYRVVYKKILDILVKEPSLVDFLSLPERVRIDLEQKRNNIPDDPALLSIDGGGIRGIEPIAILDMIEQMTGKQCYELFNCIVGTSIGGIIACGLSCPRKFNRKYHELVKQGVLKDEPEKPYSAKEILNQFKKDGPIIFGTRKNYDTTVFLFGGYKWVNKGLKDMLDNFFGDATFRDLLANSAAVVALLNEGTIKVPCRRKAWQKEKRHNYKVADICLMGASAPTYFEPLELTIPPKDPQQTPIKVPVTDGGILMNNPVDWGLQEILQSYELDVHEVRVLSLGTGIVETNEKLETYKNTSAPYWAKYIINISLKGNVPNKLAKKAAKALRIIKHYEDLNMYVRLQPTIPPAHAETDDPSQANLDFLEKTGRDMFEAHKTTLERFFKITTKPANDKVQDLPEGIA